MCFTFTFLGFVNNGDGTTTITYRVTNACKDPVNYVAIGTDAFTRIAPANGGEYRGTLASKYAVQWTGTSGNPGFTSIKFSPVFNSFKSGRQDVFSITVSGFNPNTPLQVQGQAGSSTETFTFTPSNPCS